MSARDAAEAVLRAEGRPLRAREITELAISRGLWHSDGRTPEQTMASRLATDIRQLRAASRFRRAARGQFELNSDAEPVGTPAADPAPAAVAAQATAAERPAAAPGSMSFLDAAEDVLRRSTEQALAEGLIASGGRTPEATIRAQIGVENRRREARGDQPRFLELGAGLIGLTEWQQEGVLRAIERHNEQRRAELLDNVKAMPPEDFEQLVAVLLGRLGFEISAITLISGDGGVDVRAQQLVGGVLPTRVAIQAKRWANNVRTPTVREMRGSLGAHERGMIITTSAFSPGARTEAERQDAQPIALVNGEELTALMVQTQLGVRRSAYDVIELAGALLDDPLDDDRAGEARP